MQTKESRMYVREEVEEKVLAFVKEQELLEEGDRVLAGVSGGADSVCLLFVLLRMKEYYKNKLTIEVVHVNHGLRGEAAEEDLAYVKQLCEEQQLVFHAVYVDVAALAKREGLSTEEAGRRVRYEQMARIVRERDLNVIATGHHLDDQAETILMNLFRGSGMRGMAGISSRRGNIVRPLLCLSRAKIEEYLAVRGISFQTDATNLDCVYTRNKVRNQLLPYVEANINAQAAEHIVALGATAGEVDAYFCRQAENLFEEYGKVTENGVIINVDCLRQEQIVIRYMLRLAIEKSGFGLKDISREHIACIYRLMQGQTGGSCQLPHGILAEKSYERVYIYKDKRVACAQNSKAITVEELAAAKGVTVSFQGKSFQFRVIENKKNQTFPKKKYTKWFDYDRIEFMLQLRTRRPGDWLTIDEEGSKKKLNRYFIDEKLPREEREHCILLAQSSEILWVVGGRINEAYKVRGDTQLILEVVCVSATEV